MSAILFRMNVGSPGSIARGAGLATVEPQFYDRANPFPEYGLPVVTGANGRIRPPAPGDTALNIKGVLLRPYPTGASQDPLGVSTPPFNTSAQQALAPGDDAADVMRRGYVVVKVRGNTAPAKDGPVYVRVAGGTAGQPNFGFEAAGDAGTPANTILLTNATFEGPPDANGVTSIAFNI